MRECVCVCVREREREREKERERKKEREVCFLMCKLRAHNFSSRSLKQQSSHPPAKYECGVQRGT